MELHKRRQAILALLRDTGEVDIDDLAQRFGVSGNSVRSDLDALARQGLLKRVRGGAIATADPLLSLTVSATSRLQANRQEKEAIGRWAAGMVRDNQAIILDDSSSVFQMATFLRERRNLTVVTNGLEIALLLAQEPSNQIILAANMVVPGQASLVGSLNPDLLHGFRAASCFLSCSSFSIDQGLTEVDNARARLKAQLMRLAGQKVALVDHSKFGQVSAFRIADVNTIDHLVTDVGIGAATLVELRRAARYSISVVGSAGHETFAPLVNDASRRYRIGFGNITERMVFARQVRESLENAARSFDNIDLLVRDNDFDRETALRNADWFVSQGVDLVIEYQIDAVAGNVIMDKFQCAGIPVIAVDIALPGATFFGADNYRAGRMAGEGLGYWVRSNWEGQVDWVLALQCLRIGPLAVARLQGQAEGLAAVIGPVPPERIITLDCPVPLQEVSAMVSQVLPRFRPSDRIAMIAVNDDAAVAGLDVFERAGSLRQVAAVGQNVDLQGRAALRRPHFPLIGSTSYGPEHYGKRLLELALRLLRGEPVPPAVFAPHAFVTKENIGQYYPEKDE